jgi:hypothetical protein
MMQHQEPVQPAHEKVYTVEVILERRDGSKTRDQKWIVATTPAEAEQSGLASAARRWPAHTPVGVGSIRVDHSPRARRYLQRSAHSGLSTAARAAR